MLLDHIHQFIPGVPIWFTWLGRISAPLFIFCMVWGIYHTHDRKKYLQRLYFFGLLMAVGDTLLSWLVRNPVQSYLSNNIMVTLFLISYIITAIDYIRGERGYKKYGWWMLGALGLVQVFSMGAIFVLGPKFGEDFVRISVSSILPNMLFCEGSIIFVFYGVAMYYNRNSRLGLVLLNVLYASVFFVLALSGGIESLFLLNYQWMMIASLVLMLLYNGRKGKGFKWLFYIFYPAHIFLLYWIGSLC